jgi:hypothetical protein
VTHQQRIEELRRQMSISLRAGRMQEYMSLLAQLNTLMHPKNQENQCSK